MYAVSTNQIADILHLTLFRIRWVHFDRVMIVLFFRQQTLKCSG